MDSDSDFTLRIDRLLAEFKLTDSYTKVDAGQRRLASSLKALAYLVENGD